VHCLILLLQCCYIVVTVLLGKINKLLMDTEMKKKLHKMLHCCYRCSYIVVDCCYINLLHCSFF
jgi:hypothetical protein